MPPSRCSTCSWMRTDFDLTASRMWLLPASRLQSLCQASGVSLCGRTFRQVEWTVGSHARWRLLAPTPASFAALLAPQLLRGDDPGPRPYPARLRRDAARLLHDYLDLTLSGDC
ncbi:unnamed protein product [Leptidea sinapis]|uniref:Uncharacterized protein n=1 Tax=Leptidea sinapis TaxID=189913 RepID=A0A5E4PQ26_9NEOP|nr:unnamed protein product [Leptidea sinapis]